MKIIEIEKTEKTPDIILDDESGVFELRGKFLPENIRDLGQPVMQKLKTYLDEYFKNNENLHDKRVFKVNFKLAYFNSAAAKFIADLLKLTKTYSQSGCKIKIYWYFPEDDEDMLEAGEEFSEMLGVPIQFIMISSQ